MTKAKRRPNRGPNGWFSAKSTVRVREPSRSRSPAEKAKSLPNPVPMAVDHAEPGRPPCFGLCAEMSAACDACESYNACRRAS